MKARCPVCDKLVDIGPNGADPEKTSKRQRIANHKRSVAVPYGTDTFNFHGLCAGSGRNV